MSPEEKAYVLRFGRDSSVPEGSRIASSARDLRDSDPSGLIGDGRSPSVSSMKCESTDAEFTHGDSGANLASC